MSHEKLVSIGGLAGSFILAMFSHLNFIVACFALVLFGFICFLEKKESDKITELEDKIKKIDEKVSMQMAFGGKR